MTIQNDKTPTNESQPSAEQRESVSGRAVIGAALRTLNHLGYTYHGSTHQKPPLGKAPSFTDTSPAFEEAIRQRGLLAEAIGNMAIKSGMYRADIGGMSGPQLLQACEDMASTMHHFCQKILVVEQIEVVDGGQVVHSRISQAQQRDWLELQKQKGNIL